MIITKTPFRISFFGGGTDFPIWYTQNGGAVLSTAIDKYCYISCRKLPPFFGYKHRLVYSRSEMVNGIHEIIHPAVREVFRFMNISDGLEIHHDGDLPARSGLGSSSSFTVGLLHALYALKGRMVTKLQLAKDAIFVEQTMIQETVGSQDQTIAAFGGFNKISFSRDGSIDIIPMTLSQDILVEFQRHLVLLFTGFPRYASDIEATKFGTTDDKEDELHAIKEMVDEAIAILSSGSLEGFGELLDESWALKKRFSDKVSSPKIDEIYGVAKRNGALGGKLLGAGGGGFMLFYVPPDRKERLIDALDGLLHVPFRFDTTGSQIIYYNEGDN